MKSLNVRPRSFRSHSRFQDGLQGADVQRYRRAREETVEEHCDDRRTASEPAIASQQPHAIPRTTGDCHCKVLKQRLTDANAWHETLSRRDSSREVLLLANA